MKRAQIGIFIGLLLGGCGGGGSESSSGGSAPATSSTDTTPVTTVAVQESDAFANMSVPDTFNWQTQQSATLQMQLVSNVSFANGEPLPLSGRHMTTIYPLDENGQPEQTPIYQGTTDNTGKFIGVVSLPRSASGLQIDVEVGDEKCTIVLSPEEILDADNIGCEILADSDL